MTREELTVLLSSWENLWVVKNNRVDLTPDLPMLMEIALEGRDHESWRAAWVADKLTSRKPDLISPYLGKLVESLPTLAHTGKKRQFLRMISCCPVDPEVAGSLFDHSQQLLFDPREPVAVKAYAMQILFNISEDQQELKPEVAETIGQVMEMYPEPGIQAKCKKLIHRLTRDSSRRGRKSGQNMQSPPISQSGNNGL